MNTLMHLPNMPRLSDLALAAGGNLHGDDRPFAGVGIDTRRLNASDVFFALRGERADGHAHVAAAAEMGAAAAVVERLSDNLVPQIVVTDTLRALQQAGAAWRAAFSGFVVGITGSNGKTTVRRMLTAVLVSRFGSILASKGNFNNHLGVPLTLLGLRPQHAGGVIEMGANHAGEIEALARLARPDVAVITNAGDAHLEGFGSRDGVARAKGEIYEQLSPDATAIINADDVYAGQWRDTASHCRQLYFSLDGKSLNGQSLNGKPAEITAHSVELAGEHSNFVLVTPSGEAPVELSMPGEHNVRNALAAAAVATALGMETGAIAAGLAQVTPTAGRLSVMPIHSGDSGFRLVDDSYNANPVSLTVALDWLSHQPGPRWLILGDMGELGDHADAAHREAGRQARARGVDHLWATGEKSRLAVDEFGHGGRWFADHDQLNRDLSETLAVAVSAPIVLVKGSRTARMERVVAWLAGDAGSGGASC